MSYVSYSTEDEPFGTLPNYPLVNLVKQTTM